jgi:hypothetical protein
MSEHWHTATWAHAALGTRGEWAAVERNLRRTSAFLLAQRSLDEHILHVLRDAWERPTALHHEALRIRMDLEGPAAGFATFDHALGYLRGRLAHLSGHRDDAHYRGWALPVVLSTLAHRLSGGGTPSRRMRFVEWVCERLELLVAAGLAANMNEAAAVHRGHAVALATTAQNWAGLVARPGEARVPPFFWYAMRIEFSSPRKVGACFWTAARFGFYAGDYQGAANAAGVLRGVRAMRVFEKVQAWPEHLISACAAICERRTQPPEPTERTRQGGFVRVVWLRMVAEARWARGDFSSAEEFVRWQTNTQ